MKKITPAKLKSWHRRAVAIDTAAKRLWDDMISTIGGNDKATDPIDNVTDCTETLCDVLSRPHLDMWKRHLK